MEPNNYDLIEDSDPKLDKGAIGRIRSAAEVNATEEVHWGLENSISTLNSIVGQQPKQDDVSGKKARDTAIAPIPSPSKAKQNRVLIGFALLAIGLVGIYYLSSLKAAPKV